MSTVDKPVKRKERSDDGRDERKESVKRARVALVKVDNAGAIIKRRNERTSILQAPIMKLEGHQAAVHGVKFDRTGDNIASCSFDKSIYLWRVKGPCDVYNVLSGHKNAVLDVDWSGDGSAVFSASADKTVALWDATSGKRVKKLAGHTSFVNAVAAVPRGPEVVISGSDDGTVKLWDVRTRRCSQTFPHKYQITAVASSLDGDVVYAGTLDDQIMVWDVRKGAVTMNLLGHTDTLTGLALSPDGHHLLSNCMDNTVRAWDVRPFCAGDRCVRTFAGASHGFEKILLRCAWDKEGRRVAAGSSDRCVYVWEFETGKLEYKLPGHTGSVNGVHFSPRQPIIASCSSDKSIYLGELAE